jgi:tRNA1Val (adenine37-N6)-methyltransferase
MKVTTDACLFGAWLAEEVKTKKLKIKNVLDAGAGTGLLSLMFAQKNPDVVIDAIEIDDDSYQQAKKNIKASPWHNRINILHGDIKTFSFEKKYDLIISNPPFYEKEIKSNNPKKNVAHHDEGFLFDDLLMIIKKNLSPHGFFSLLLPFKRNVEAKKLLRNFLVLQMILIKQTPAHNYSRTILLGCQKNEKETMIDEILICDDQNQYTNEFKNLLKDYYLHL